MSTERYQLINDMMDEGYGFDEAMSLTSDELETDETMSKRNRSKNRNKYNKKKYQSIVEKLNMYKIYVVGGNMPYASWLPMQAVNSIEEADLVMFTGGADVNPELYGEERGSLTSINLKRDAEEVAAFKDAVAMNKKIIGICRGAQLSCVLSGGSLVQDTNNHNGNHSIICSWEKAESRVDISSDHHQMMYPFNLPDTDYRMLAYSENKLGTRYLNGKDENIAIPKTFREPEVVVFTRTKALGIQGHPEWMDLNSQTVHKLRNLVHTFMLIKQFKD